jgi:hypothetical protein
MKPISFDPLATVALAIFALSISAPMLSSGAYASVMDGKYGCSDHVCQGINAPGYGKKSWTCTSLRQACLQRNAGSAQCRIAHTKCMRTGIFADPQGTVNNVATQ